MEGGRGGLSARPFALSSCRYADVDDHIYRHRGALAERACQKVRNVDRRRTKNAGRVRKRTIALQNEDEGFTHKRFWLCGLSP